jgi:hypothetical protein
MKNLKITLLSILLLLPALLFAQDFHFTPKSATKVRVATIPGKIILESHTGKDIIISSSRINHDEDDVKDKEGLQLINGAGVQDNTGTGVNITETDGVVIIRGASQKSEGDIKILIPEKMNLLVTSKGWIANNIKINGFKSEIEIKSEYAHVSLSNVTGPIVLNATYGHVKAVFDKVNQEKPISMIATYGTLDVSLPADTKADLQLESDYGSIYTDFQIAMDKTIDDDNMELLKKKDVVGKINSGGVKIHLKSPYKNVYVRKRK